MSKLSLPPTPLSRLCLGTVQLGLPYGAANRTGMPGAEEARAMIGEALERGVRLFDTAQAYGLAEERLGDMAAPLQKAQALIITKLAPMEMAEGESLNALEARVEEAVRGSLSRLKLASLPCLMLHRAEHLHLYQGRIWQRLKQLQRQGLIARLGVSVATPEELRAAMGFAEVACVQLPFNIADGRWRKAGVLPLRQDVTVFARSALLQGVLTQEPGEWPVLSPAQASHVAGLLGGWVREFTRESPLDLCLAYVRAQGWIDAVVLGMESLAQLRHNLSLFEQPALTEAQCAAIDAAMPALPEGFLNPALWPAREVSCAS